MTRNLLVALGLAMAFAGGCAPKQEPGDMTALRAKVSENAPAEVKKLVSDLESAPVEQRPALLQQNQPVVNEIMSGNDEGAKTKLTVLMNGAPAQVR